jgi:hypothetical protein
VDIESSIFRNRSDLQEIITEVGKWYAILFDLSSKNPQSSITLARKALENTVKFCEEENLEHMKKLCNEYRKQVIEYIGEEQMDAIYEKEL